MKRTIWLLGVFAAGAAAGAVAATARNDRGAAAAGQRLARAEVRHAAEIAELARDRDALLEINHDLDERIVDLEFMVGHATAQVRETGEIPGEYDYERFLRRNPDARKYFPYLTDAVERYAHIWPVDPMFALAILKQESDFGRHVVSYAGALGDAQFVASTARRYGLDAREPYSWVAGRRNFTQAASVRRDARNIRDRFLSLVEPDLEGPANEVRARLQLNIERHISELHSYYERLAYAGELQRKGDEAYREYQHEIDMALAEVRDIERDVRARQKREANLIHVTGIRSPKSSKERDIEVQLIVNDYLAGVDPRLSPMLLVDALVHHLADLHKEFHGDRRLVASRYNASRRAMEAAVASIGGGVGIPLLDETQDYVNRVVTYHAFFVVDGGVLDSYAVNTRLASR